MSTGRAEARADAADNALRNISLALGGTDEWTDQETMIAYVQARADALARRLAEAESLIEALCIYGDIHTVENVSYPGLYGTHAETLDRARAFLLSLASPDNGGWKQRDPA